MFKYYSSLNIFYGLQHISKNNIYRLNKKKTFYDFFVLYLRLTIFNKPLKLVLLTIQRFNYNCVIRALIFSSGSLPKLRELQVVGNPFDYPIADIVKKGSKYLIRFLQEQWKMEQQSNNETIIFNNEANTIKNVDKKILRKDNTKNKKTVIYATFTKLNNFFFYVKI